MKFPPRLIIASPTTDLPDHLSARGYALIHAQAGLPSPQDVLAQAIDRAKALSGSLPISLSTTLEDARPFAPNKSTLYPKHLAAFVARACAELTAVALILHGHDRIRQGPHCIVLAGFALAATPASSLAELSLHITPNSPAILGVAAIQPDSGSGECFDEPLPRAPLPPWGAIDARLDEMLEHWSIQPSRQRRPNPA